MNKDQLDLSLLERSPQALTKIRSLLIQFEQYHQVHVQLRLVQRLTARQELLAMAYHQPDVDISEIEAAWLTEFAGLGAFQRLGPRHLNALEGQDQFLRANWQACQLESSRGQLTAWAIPWSAAIPCIFYRPGLLQAAGIDPQTAFDSLEHIDATIARLASHGVRIPLVMPVNLPQANLCCLVSWVWCSGGELMDAVRTRPTLDGMPVLQGMRAYYRLGNYLPRDLRQLSPAQAEEAFTHGSAAVMLASTAHLAGPHRYAELGHRLGLAAIPGSPCVDGTQLGIWRHSKKRQEALLLVKFLASCQAAELLHAYSGLPVRHDILEAGHYVSDPSYRLLADSLRGGRSFPTGNLASALHTHLEQHAAAIWKEIFNTSRPDLEQIIGRHVQAIQQHFTGLSSAG